jgi:hypothetical protein
MYKKLRFRDLGKKKYRFFVRVTGVWSKTQFFPDTNYTGSFTGLYTQEITPWFHTTQIPCNHYIHIFLCKIHTICVKITRILCVNQVTQTPCEVSAVVKLVGLMMLLSQVLFSLMADQIGLSFSTGILSTHDSRV